MSMLPAGTGIIGRPAKLSLAMFVPRDVPETVYIMLEMV